jgi:fumarate hydratase class II
MRGRINPKVMTMMTGIAVAPFAAMVTSRVAGAVGSTETNSMIPLAAWNGKKPGIIETTAEKARAANGRWQRSAIGATMTLTRMQAANAPVATFAPTNEINAQRAACASMPATIGNGS